MKVEMKKLKAGLESLTGRDFVEAASEEQASSTVANSEVGITLRLAAKALNVPPQQLLELPLRDFMRLTQWLGAYFGDISAEETSEESTAE